MTYYDWLFKESEEEKEINRKLDEERERYEATDAYKEHQAKLEGLWNDLKEAGKKRREEAKEHRPKRRGKKFSFKSDEEIAEIRRKNQEAHDRKVEAMPDDLKAVIRGYEALDETQKKVFQQTTWAYRGDYDDYKDPVTTEKDMKELLEILVQTTIDFINERGLTDIYSVGFGADDLQGSAKFGEWEPCTDASIHVTGMGKEKGKDGQEYTVCQNIGEYM